MTTLVQVMSNESNKDLNSNEYPLELRKGQLLGDSLGQVGSVMTAVIYTSFIMYFLTNIVHMNPSTTGTIALLGSIIGALGSLATGLLIDKYKTKNGRARPWIARSVLPMVFSLLILTAIRDGMDLAMKLVFVSAGILLYKLSISVQGTAQSTLMGLASRNPHERAKIGTARGVSSFVGGTIITVAFLPLAQFLGGGQQAYLIATGAISIVSALLVFYQYKTARESVDNVQVYDQEVVPKITVKEMLKSFLTNKFFYIAISVSLLSTLTSTLTSSSGVYYAQYILGSVGLQPALAAAGALPAILAFAILPIITKKMSIRWTVGLGALLALLGSVIRLLDTSNVVFGITGAVLNGVGFVPVLTYCGVMINNAADYGEWKTGIRAPGVINSVNNTAYLLGTAIGLSSVGWILGITHYDGAAASQASSAIQGILSLSIYIPMISSLLIFVCSLFWGLDRIFPQITKELRDRHIN
ncbi:MFS transporter [Paenibacillus sp. LjRoot153]|uniref:MFS transporter n=1 Tax=Paenibacillus sp. LjRoot153 TaxID=3342270 RepID=UPI003ECEA5C9